MKRKAMFAECPKCSSIENHLILWDIRNWFRFLLELPVLLLFIAFENALGFNGFALHHQCDQCGEKFLGHKEYRRVPRGLCPHCHYNLTGNTSGTCPECGSQISKQSKNA